MFLEKNRSLQEVESLEKDMSGRGGPRHKAKPHLDTHLLYQILVDHKDLVQDMGSYEYIGTSSAPDIRGLVRNMDLWVALGKAEPTAEVTPAPLKQALLSLLTNHTEMNNSKHRGEVWVQLRANRITILLAHVRKVKRDGNLALEKAAARLCMADFHLLQNGLKHIQPTPVLPLEKGPLEKGKEATPQKGDRRLSKNDSDVSMDSNGWPKFESPSKQSLKKEQSLEKDEQSLGKDEQSLGKDEQSLGKDEQPLEKGEVASSSLARKRKAGQRLLEKAEDLQEAMGIGLSKKPAASPKALGKAKAKPKTLKKAEPLEKGVRKPWVKIKKTKAEKPIPRAYLQGSTEEGEKLHLIVEVSSKRSDHYEKIIDEIHESLEKDSLTKPEALALREELCSKYG